MTVAPQRRTGYTLLELMVAVGLIVVLATLTVAIANSSLVDSYRIVGGADRVSGWLLNAKNRALRDRTPIGLQLIRNSTNPTDPEFNYVRSAQLIELPVLYAPVQEPDPNAIPASAPFICVRYADQVVRIGGTDTPSLIQDSAANPNDPIGVFMYWPTAVSPYPTFTAGVDLNVGDLLQINELNSLHKITVITPIVQPTFYTNLGKPALASGQWYKLTLATSSIPLEITPSPQHFPPSPPHPTNLLPSNFPHTVGGMPPTLSLAGTQQAYPVGYPPIGAANYYETHFFGLFKAPRPVLGEPILQLPANMAIDVFPGQDNAPIGLSANDLLPLSQNIPVNLEIVFNPNGSVMYTDQNPIVLWLRDTRNGGGQEPLLVTNVNVPAPGVVEVDRARLMNAGEHVLVSINTKTGAIGTFPIYPPDQTQRYQPSEGGRNGPYRYALKAANTGL
jgi:prepilin-type N-terminal cleavage/methylation domain-containing protein